MLHAVSHLQPPPLGPQPGLPFAAQPNLESLSLEDGAPLDGHVRLPPRQAPDGRCVSRPVCFVAGCVCGEALGRCSEAAGRGLPPRRAPTTGAHLCAGCVDGSPRRQAQSCCNWRLMAALWAPLVCWTCGHTPVSLASHQPPSPPTISLLAWSLTSLPTNPPAPQLVAAAAGAGRTPCA